MEVGVRIIGIILRFLNFILAPLYWFRARNPARLPPIKNPILLKSATQLAAEIRNGNLKSEELVSIYIERIIEVNSLINAVVEDRFHAALEDAKAVDQKISEYKRNGKTEELFKGKPLLGVPFTVKESCSLAGLSNAVGCLEYAGRRATSDGEVVRLVKQAGGIPLLVSNTPELCLGWETTNLLKGTTNNPYHLKRTAGGSSGGEGALLACGASPLSVASDIAGSIRLPAAFCGVFGHKPTPGIISIEGHIPTLTDERYPRFLVVGPMARRAEDLELMMQVMAGDRADELQLNTPVDIKDIKVHYMTDAGNSIAMLGVDRNIKDMIEKAANYLHKDCGATLCKETFKDLEDSVEISVSLFFSMKDIPNLLQDPANPKKDKSLIVELIKCAFGGGTRTLQGLGFALIKNSQLFIPESRRGYYENKANTLREHLQRTLGRSGVLLYPTFCRTAHEHRRVFVRASGVLYTMPFNVLGLPAVSVPLARDRGMPVGIQVIAAPNQDRLCLAVAKQLEIGFGGWQPPN